MKSRSKEFIKELRGLFQEELAKRENELKKELFELRFQAAAGQLEQTGRLKEVKNRSLVSKLFNQKLNRLGKENFNGTQ